MDKAQVTNPHQPYFLIEEIQQMCDVVRQKNMVPHVHNYYSLYWITKGEAIHATQYVEYPIEAGSIFFVPANLSHKMLLNPDTAGFTILFNNVYLDSKTVNSSAVLKTRLFNNPEFNSIVKLDGLNKTKFEGIVQMILDEYRLDYANKDDAIASLLRLLLLHSNRLFEEQHPDEQTAVASDKKLVIEFKKLIESDFFEKKDVSYYAQALNMRPSCLNEISKKYTGITAGELIRNRVIDEAKKLLYSTDWSSKEIAFHLGFNDPAYFSRFFKKYTDSTLTGFRTAISKKYKESVV